MKAIKIDSASGKASAIELTVTDGDSGCGALVSEIGCEFFTAITLKRYDDGTHETIYCDDEGAINGTKHGVLHANYGPIFGNLVIVGTSADGESIDTKLSVGDLENESLNVCFEVNDGKMDFKFIEKGTE